MIRSRTTIHSWRIIHGGLIIQSLDISKLNYEHIKAAEIDFGAVQKRVNLVDLGEFG